MIGLRLAQWNQLVHGLLPLQIAGIMSLFLRFGAHAKLIQWERCLGQLIDWLHLLRKFGRTKLNIVLLQNLVLQA
jgi:hypothetical protein